MEEKKVERKQRGGGLRGKVLEFICGNREEKSVKDVQKRLVLSLLFVLPLLAVTWEEWDTSTGLILEIVLVIPIIIVNFQVFIDGFTAVRRKAPEKNTLAAYGSIIALLLLQFDAAGVFLTTMALCRCSEAYVNYKLDDHLKKLMEAEPEDPELEPGTVITVSKGDVIPADGTILTGESAIDEELITGERVPQKRGPEEAVFAGTRNLSSAIEMKVLRCGQDTTISRIIEHITVSIATRPPIAARAERFGHIYALAAVILALVAAVVWHFCGGSVVEVGMTAVTVLIIANPYAFSVGVPISILAATVRGAKNGILLRSAHILELARDIDTIAMNKTGTITDGKPELSDVISISDGFSLRLAGAIEQYSQHPLAREIARAARQQHGQLPEAETEYVPGRGVRAVVDGRRYLSGNEAFMRENGISVNLPEAEPLFIQGKSVIFYANESRVIGMIALRDAPNSVSLKAISRIEGMGIDVVMLTGDCLRTSEAIQDEVGLDQVVAEIRPEEKARIIQELRDNDEKLVAMVGDGVDDAAPIASADIGIAVGVGPRIGVQSADVLLISDDLMDVVRAIGLSRKTIRIIRQNMAFAHCYNIVAMLATAGLLVWLTGPVVAPLLASLCMCASQILVVASTMRIKRTEIG